MDKKDLLTIWGYLESYKIELQQSVRMLQNLWDNRETLCKENRELIRPELIADHRKDLDEITRLQRLIEAAAPIEE